MLSFKCENCNGELSVDSSGALYCEYCGSRFHFSDEQLRGYKEFRGRMLRYLRETHERKAGEGRNEDALWNSAEYAYLKSADDNDITIRYLYRCDDGPFVTMYLTREAFLFHLKKEARALAEAQERALQRLSFPPADVNGLRDCFPVAAGTYPLDNGGLLLAFKRAANLFPLPLFGALAAEHAAWVVSRMENICCVLAYSDMAHKGISENSLAIDPFTHHAVLIGHWWEAGYSSEGSAVDLKAVRTTALRILGVNRSTIPKEFAAFLSSAPRRNAYEDFALWDSVIEKGFGGRRFAKMNIQI